MPAPEHGEYADDFRALATLAEGFTQLVEALRAHPYSNAAADDDP